MLGGGAEIHFESPLLYNKAKNLTSIYTYPPNKHNKFFYKGASIVELGACETLFQKRKPSKSYATSKGVGGMA